METKTFRHPVIQLVGPLKGSCIEGTRSQCKILTFRNVGNHSPNDAASHLRRTNSQDVAFEVYTASVEKKMAGLEFCTNAARCSVGRRTSIHFYPESWHSMGKRKPVVWFRYFSFSFPLRTAVALRNFAAARCKMQLPVVLSGVKTWQH